MTEEYKIRNWPLSKDAKNSTVTITMFKLNKTVKFSLTFQVCTMIISENQKQKIFHCVSTHALNTQCELNGFITS